MPLWPAPRFAARLLRRGVLIQETHLSSVSLRRFAMLGTGLAATAVVATVAITQLPATAAAPAAVQAAAPDAAPAVAPSVAEVQAANKSTYGVATLPVEVRDIQKYKLNKKTIKEIVAAKKLAATSEARKIRSCESGGNYRISTGNGYYGAYQFDRSTWLSNGGGRYANTANGAPSWAQDHIMWKTHEARGWSPWGCA